MKTYQNMDEAFYDINKRYLTDPHSIIEYNRGAQSFTEDLFFKVKNPVTSINLYNFAFDPARKWNHLIRSYIDYEDYVEFWNKVTEVTGTAYQFRFKNRKGPNGPCLIAIVLTRETSKVPWKRAKVIWRTSELQRKWAADLVLIHNFFREIPDHAKEMIDIQEVSFYLAQAFQSWRLVGPLIESFCDMDEVDTSHPHGEKALDSYYKVYNADPQPPIKFAPVKRMQKYFLSKMDGELGESHPDDLSIMDELMKKQGGNKK